MEFLMEHAWKIGTAIASGVGAVAVWLIRTERWRTKTESRLEDLEETRESLRDCLPVLKKDVAAIKTERAVDHALFERMEKTLVRIEEKIDKKD